MLHKGKIDHVIKIFQEKGVIVENMMEIKQITYQDRERECVAFSQG